MTQTERVTVGGDTYLKKTHILDSDPESAVWARATPDVTDAVRLVAQAARMSFHSFSDTEEKPHSPADALRLVHYLLRHQHTSPFEAVTFTVVLRAPIFVLRQIMRHRTFSYNEVSARYTEVDEAAYVPLRMRYQAEHNRQASEGELDEAHNLEAAVQYETALQGSQETYARLLSLGVAREQARGVLPVAGYSTVMMTGNLNNWFKFFSLRLGEGVQPETRAYAQTILDMLGELSPMAELWRTYYGEAVTLHGLDLRLLAECPALKQGRMLMSHEFEDLASHIPDDVFQGAARKSVLRELWQKLERLPYWG